VGGLASGIAAVKKGKMVKGKMARIKECKNNMSDEKRITVAGCRGADYSRDDV